MNVYLGGLLAHIYLQVFASKLNQAMDVSQIPAPQGPTSNIVFPAEVKRT